MRGTVRPDPRTSKSFPARKSCAGWIARTTRSTRRGRGTSAPRWPVQDVGTAVGKIASATLALSVPESQRAGLRRPWPWWRTRSGCTSGCCRPGTPGDAIRRARTAADVDRILTQFMQIAAGLNSSATSFEDAIAVQRREDRGQKPTTDRAGSRFGPAFRDFTLTPVDLTGGRIGPQSRRGDPDSRRHARVRQQRHVGQREHPHFRIPADLRHAACRPLPLQSQQLRQLRGAHRQRRRPADQIRTWTGRARGYGEPPPSNTESGSRSG